MVKILVVEDDAKLNQVACAFLNDRGYEAKGAMCARDAYELMYNSPYDVIVSDISMPDIDGFEFAETVRDMNKTIPILLMTAHDGMAFKKRGFQLGIDDYMVKPVNLEELAMRVGAILRRANIAQSKMLTAGNMSMDADATTISVDGDEVPVTVREFKILYKLLSYPKKTFTRQQLMDEFWGIDTEATLRAVDVYIAKLRDKLSACDGFKIVTVHGLGYKAVIS